MSSKHELKRVFPQITPAPVIHVELTPEMLQEVARATDSADYSAPNNIPAFTK